MGWSDRFGPVSQGNLECKGTLKGFCETLRILCEVEMGISLCRV